MAYCSTCRSMHSSSVMREVSSYSREELAETHNWTVYRECETMGHLKLHGKSSSNHSRHKDQGNRECKTMGHSVLNGMSSSTPPQDTRIYGKDDTEIQYVKSRKVQATPKEHRLPDTTGQICMWTHRACGSTHRSTGESHQGLITEMGEDT